MHKVAKFFIKIHMNFYTLKISRTFSFTFYVFKMANWSNNTHIPGCKKNYVNNHTQDLTTNSEFHILDSDFFVYCLNHGLLTPNEGINQRNMKIWADVADKICFGRSKKFGSGSWFSAVQ